MTATGEDGSAGTVRIGIGLPTTTPDRGGPVLVDWARRAEDAGFTSLGVIDRVAYDGDEPMVALACAAAATSRITLVTMVVVGPLRETGLLAKQAATLDSLSGGRLVLGLSIGARREDYLATGAAWRDRGARLSAQIARMRDVWEDAADREAPGPPPARPGGPPVLVGGLSGASMLRAARHASGYVHGGGPPRAFASAAGRARAAWIDAGRPGEPALWGQSYVALGDPDEGTRYMRDYYAFTGSFVERIAAGLLTSPRRLRDHVRGYADAGCEELVLLPATSDPAELDRIAEVVL